MAKSVCVLVVTWSYLDAESRRTYTRKKIAGRPQKHRRKQQCYSDRMSKFAIRLLLALAPHANHTRRRPYGTLEKVVLAHVPAAVRNVTNAGTERCSR
jgi:hypothetical protein